MELNNLILQNSDQLSNFINQKLTSTFFGHKNRKELVRLLPIIMTYTNNHNCKWMDNLYFLKEENFLDVFIENLNKFNFENNIWLLDKSFFICFHLKLNNQQAKKLVDKILECNCPIDRKTIESLYIIIQKSNSKLIEYLLQKYMTNEKTCNTCISLAISKKEALYSLYQNVDYILANIKEADLFYIKYITRENREVRSKVKHKIDANQKECVMASIKHLYMEFLSKNKIKLDEPAKKQLEVVLEVVYLLIDDICKNEHIQISDMEILNSGGFSTVLELGGKVIKVGCERGSKTYPNNPYVNAMLLRKEFSIASNLSFIVEVNEKVDTNTDISEEELYQLYKKVRELHLIWVDVAKRNVGRLLKDNKISWRENLPITDERLGLAPYRGEEILLKAGEIVILDNDLICDEDDYDKIKGASTELQMKFEQRYRQEKEELNRYTEIKYRQENSQNNEIAPHKRR